jgi:general stress protein 26
MSSRASSSLLLTSIRSISKTPRCSSLSSFKPTTKQPSLLSQQTKRLYHPSSTYKMPEQLTQQEVSSKTDPSVSKQYDDETPKPQQISEFYNFVDGKKIGLLTTIRPDIGPVSRSMAIAKRVGPDFLFLANAHSRKFQDLESSKNVQITFQDSSNQDWASVTGTATTTSNSDPRIKDLWSSGTKAWFGDLGDGVHDGSAEDPRMTLIEVKASYVVYWLHQVGALGFVKEVGVAALTGKVANTGVTRELVESDIEKARSEA